MDTVGLRELRQSASEIVKRVEHGEEIVVTVAGRPSARLVPETRRRWCRWDEVRELFDSSGDPDWAGDRDLLDHDLRDPWEDG